MVLLLFPLEPFGSRTKIGNGTGGERCSSCRFDPASMNIAQIRKNIRHQRRALSSHRQTLHQQAVIRHLLRSNILIKHKRFAIYLDSDGELATTKIIRQLHRMKKQVYLPVLYPFTHKKLWFLPYKKQTLLYRNRFGIAEPAFHNRKTLISSLNIIFMPLVAFDEQGNRIGMGGGFYDRTLWHCKIQQKKTSPLLIGLAHELQKINKIEKRSWDIPLDAVITEKKLRKFTKALT